jgi:hypothetical protein
LLVAVLVAAITAIQVLQAVPVVVAIGALVPGGLPFLVPLPLLLTSPFTVIKVVEATRWAGA